jgi:hypothetical protein
MGPILKSGAIAVIIALGVSTVASEASVTRKLGGAAGEQQLGARNCVGAVRLSHPGLKGPGFKAEFDKCTANPKGYQ